MRLGYQEATISFCIDLTSPHGESIPVASLLVGEVERRSVAGVAVLVPDQLDPLTKAVLNDTHQLLRQYVNEAFQQRSPEAPLGDVLARVYRSLRNSMHVSAISEPAEIEVAEIGLLGGTVVNLCHRGLVRALTEAGLVTVEHTPRPVLLPARPMWARPSSIELPPSFVWEPPPSESMAAAAV